MYTITFNQNTGIPGVGSATATKDDFTYSVDRLDANNAEEVTKFSDETKARYDEFIAKKEDVTDYANLIATELNKQ